MTPERLLLCIIANTLLELLYLQSEGKFDIRPLQKAIRLSPPGTSHEEWMKMIEKTMKELAP